MTAATVIGFAPEKSPSLTDYPACDKKLAELAGRMWGDGKTTAAKRTIGKGTLFTCTAADTAGMALDSRGYRTTLCQIRNYRDRAGCSGGATRFRKRRIAALYTPHLERHGNLHGLESF